MKNPTIFILSVVLFLGGTLNVFGQHLFNTKEFTFSIGSNFGSLKDSNFSPLNYNQRGQTITLNYQTYGRQTGNLFGIKLAFSPNLISTEGVDYFSSDYYLGTISLAYLKNKNLIASNQALHIGGQLQSDLQLVDFEGLDAFTYLFAHSLALKGKYSYEIGRRHRLQSSLSIPVLSYIVRPPHNGYNKTTEANEDSPLKLISVDGQLTSLKTYQTVNWMLEYRYAVGQKWELAVGYQLLYQRHKDIHQFTRFNHQISLGGVVRF